MKKTVFIFAFLLLVSVYEVRAQTCDLASEKLPVIRGLKLGMPFDDALKILTQAPKSNPDEYGFQKIKAIDDLRNEYRDNVRGIFVNFLDEKVVSFSVHYASQVYFKDADAVEKSLIENLKLPIAFTQGMENSNLRYMRCRDFYTSFYFRNNTFAFEITDLFYEKTIDKRKEELDEKRRKAFKP